MSYFSPTTYCYVGFVRLCRYMLHPSHHPIFCGRSVTDALAIREPLSHHLELVQRNAAWYTPYDQDDRYPDVKMLLPASPADAWSQEKIWNELKSFQNPVSSSSVDIPFVPLRKTASCTTRTAAQRVAYHTVQTAPTSPSLDKPFVIILYLSVCLFYNSNRVVGIQLTGQALTKALIGENLEFKCCFCLLIFFYRTRTCWDCCYTFSIYLSICLSFCLSIYLAIPPSLYPSIHPSI